MRALIPARLLAVRRQLAGSVRRHPRFPALATAVLLSAMFMVNLTVTLISVAVPRIAGEFSASEGSVVWAVTGPILVAAVLGPTCGKAGDLYGHRRIFILGLALNAGFTVLIALSASAPMFVVTRILAAAGGAAAAPTALAFINRLFDPQHRAGALGWWSFVMAGSPVLGVVVGGLLIDSIGWRWIFVIQAPLVVLGAVLAAVILPETPRAERVRFDVAGAVTLALAVGTAMLGVTLGPQRGWTDSIVLTLPLVAVAALVWFVQTERRAPSPLIPPEYWRRRNFVFPTATLALVNVGYMGSFVLMPLMLQTDEFGYSAAQTSRIIIARPLAFAMMGLAAGRLAVQLGERNLAVFGAAAIAVSMLMLTRFEPSSSTVLVAGALAVAGLGMGSAAPAMTAMVANTVSQHHLGVAGAAQQMLQQVGLVLGIQGLQAVQASLEHNGVASSYHVAFAIGAVVAVLGLGTALLVRSVRRVREPVLLG